MLANLTARCAFSLLLGLVGAPPPLAVRTEPFQEASAAAEQEAGATTQEAAWWTPSQPRILLLASETESDHPRYREDLTEDLLRRLQRNLIQARHQVVLGTEIKDLQQRARNLQKSYVGETHTNFEQFLCETAQTDYLIRVAVRVDSEKTQQRRMLVSDRVQVTVTAAQDPVAVFMDELKGEGHSVDSYRDAHENALENAAGNPTDAASIVGNLKRLLDERLAEERQKGRRYYVNLQSNVKELNWAMLAPKELRALTNVTDLREAVSVPERASYELRFKGSRLELKEALFAALETKRAAYQRETGHDVAILFASSMSSIDVLFTPREANPATLEDELKIELLSLARSLYNKRPDWYLGVPVKFKPAHIASAAAERSAAESFVRKYWEKYEEIQRKHQGIDPLTYEGSVEIENQPFDSLAEAKARAEEVTANYYDSLEGRLATSLAKMTEQAFATASDNKIQGVIEDDVQKDVLFMIKSEMDLYQNSGAVDPSSVAFFNREGTKRMVFTRIHRVLDAYQLWLTVVDAENGLKQQGTVQLSSLLTDRLEQQLNK